MQLNICKDSGSRVGYRVLRYEFKRRVSKQNQLEVVYFAVTSAVVNEARNNFLQRNIRLSPSTHRQNVMMRNMEQSEIRHHRRQLPLLLQVQH